MKRGTKCSPETLERMRAHRPSAESNEKRSRTLRGRKRSPEFIEKMREVRAGQAHTLAAREKMSNSWRRRPTWKGGHTGTTAGRTEAREVAGGVLGRPLKWNEVVHHIDGNPFNNATNNLLICSRSYHGELEQRIRKLANRRLNDYNVSQQAPHCGPCGRLVH